MRLLDLFCGAGGSAVGYHRAGFDEIVGVDNRPQKNYPFEFVLADALEYVAEHGHEFDAIHASPPCQAYSDLKTSWNARTHPELVGPTRTALDLSGRPYVIENVEGAPLENPLILCGSMFGLGAEGFTLRRHRLFEIWPPVYPMIQPCRHGRKTIGVYGDHVRSRGHWRKGADFPNRDKQALASGALDIDWMTWPELTQAIPPAYTTLVGAQLLQHIQATAEDIPA